MEGMEFNKIIFQWHFALSSLFTGIAQLISSLVLLMVSLLHFIIMAHHFPFASRITCLAYAKEKSLNQILYVKGVFF